MRVVLELLRIMIIFGVLGVLGMVIIENIYAINGTTRSYSWLGALAIIILLFVLYRNKLQFSGWYKGGQKLSKKVSVALIFVSGMLIIAPFLLGLLK